MNQEEEAQDLVLIKQRSSKKVPHDREPQDLHYQLRKCCGNIFEDLKTLEEYEQQMKKKDKQQKKKKDKDKANDAEEKEGEKEELPIPKEITEKNQAEQEIPSEKPIEKNEKEGGAEKEGKEGADEEVKQEEEEEEMVVDCDLLFIMDCTGSMSSYINMCRTELFLIVEQVKQQFAKSILKIGFIGFRDFGDTNMFEIYPFTTEYTKLKSFINGLQATGGNDTAEDVAGAFAKALEMSWTCEAKYAVLITDAYPHGNRYSPHNSGDRYPNGDPEGRVPENQIVQMIKKGITFYGLDVSATSNHMYQVFNQAVLRQTGKNMERIPMTNNANQLNNQGLGGKDLPAFAKAISTSVTKTITQTLTAKTLKSQKDVFNSKIMKIINNNRKFATGFSKTNLSSKTEDEMGIDEYKNFKRGYRDYYDSSDDSDEERFYRNYDGYGSSDDEFYHEEDLFYPNHRKNNNKTDHEPKREKVENSADMSIQPVKNTFYVKEEVGIQLHQLNRMQEQKRERLLIETDAIIEENDELNEEQDEPEYVKKRKERILTSNNSFNSTESTKWLSDQELLEALELPMMPSIRFEPIQVDYSGEQEFFYFEPFSIQKEEVPDKMAQAKQRKRATDDDFTDRKIDPYIKKLSEEEDKKVFQSICYSFQIDDSTTIDWEEPQLVQNEIKTVFTVNKKRFSEGAMRDAYMASDKDYGIELVAKLHKEADLNTKYNFLKKELTALILAQFFLTEFNQRILFTIDIANLPPQILRYVDCYIYEVIDEEQSKYPYFYSVENLMKGDFQKYNNNAGYCIDGDLRKESQLSQAFSHFTWQYSQGNCMVVDLQGTEDGQLTDPQIHTLKKTKKFGQGDLGYEGILRFFRSHTCTEYCKGLNLIHPKFIKEIKADYEFEDFLALQKQQIAKQKKLNAEYKFEEEDPKQKPKFGESQKKEGEEVSNAVLSNAEGEQKSPEEEQNVEKAHKYTFEERAETKYVTIRDEDDKYGVFGIDDFFCLDIDEKLIDSFLNPIKKVVKAKTAVPEAPAVPAKPVANPSDLPARKQDCTMLICSLCKKVGEYNTKKLLDQNKQLNHVVCADCEEQTQSSAKKIFECQVCKQDFEISSYILRMKRIDKATRCQTCSLY